MCLPFFHKWSKWGQYQVDSYRDRDDKRHVFSRERRQKRTCKKCGKEQDELVVYTD